jgi:hypothetical protein
MISVPGKIFLMGEYSVIEGGKAVVAALKPAFKYSTDAGTDVAIHSDSPIGKYLIQTQQKLTLKMSHPGLGAGFGTSTAELIAGLQLINGTVPSTASIWAWYRKEFPLASGADLAAQLESIHTNHAIFEISKYQQIRPLGYTAIFKQFFLFQVPSTEKLATHVDLKKPRSAISTAEANQMVDRFEAALANNAISEMTVLTDWANWLSSHGLETAHAKMLRTRFMQIAGVIGFKGCGAGLNDVFVVAIDANTSAESKLMTAANEFQLRFLGNLEEHLC